MVPVTEKKPRQSVPKDFEGPKESSQGRPYPSDMTAHDLAAIGEILFGKRWQQPLAQHIGVNRSTINRWVNGQRAIPIPEAMAIRSLVKEALQR